MNETDNYYYVYALIDPRDNQIFYIGKGKGNRLRSHFLYFEKLKNADSIEARKPFVSNPKKKSVMLAIINSGNELKHKIIAEKLSEESSYILEEILIERFGREVDGTGKLINLLPGGKDKYPKPGGNIDKITSMETVREKYPELISILEDYPHIASEYIPPMPWYKAKIPASKALYQYSLKGEFIAVHHQSYMGRAIGMSYYWIDACIEKNEGYAYESQWSRVRREKMQDLTLLPADELLKLKEFSDEVETGEPIREIIINNYPNRNQDVEGNEEWFFDRLKISPNPFFTSSTTVKIEYELRESAKVIFTVYDFLKKEIIKVIEQDQPKGKQQLIWNNIEGLRYGIYYYKFQVGKQVVKGELSKIV